MSVWNFRESKRKFTELEGKLREDLLMAKIRDTENSQCVAELTQKISNLEFKVREREESSVPDLLDEDRNALSYLNNWPYAPFIEIRD